MQHGPSADASSPPCGSTQACDVPEAGSVDALYLDHALFLRNVAIRKFNVPPAEAHGLVHDVFINYLVITERSRPRDVRGYLIGAICNASRNYWRSRRTEDRVFTSDEDAAGSATVEDGAFEAVSMSLIVASILARLGGRCREVLKRYYLDGQDTPAIAAAIHTTSANVNYLMHACRKKARAVYEGMVRAR